MGNIRSAPKGLLFQALTLSEAELLLPAENFLQRRYGKVLLSYGPFGFDVFTDYYREEMGGELQKKFYLFTPLISLEHSYRYKLDSQSLELRYLQDGRRRINCDPGFLTLYQLNLLSTKAYSHRNYLAEGIYAETTLIACGKRFEPLPWTYPDYKTPEALDFFAEGKQILKKILAGSEITIGEE
ncbi:MAG: DUF4416 family protein [Candidatus Marinimicrobia bacterium]|jgi:hypothetical protein|nr:DUF4416 family protein [Candidatus Neomarinimicrobiota bacterium]MDD4960658.1 DUF4416 family protein [Candidatus Neomarinimicrobiota bacterium]MDD5709087.1 DUF4416 family protein [Candidatus Neomarinimicrobiota bacterium]MDX9778087.1 DUF4416 family protein [bacterium]